MMQKYTETYSYMDHMTCYIPFIGLYRQGPSKDVHNIVREKGSGAYFRRSKQAFVIAGLEQRIKDAKNPL